APEPFPAERSSYSEAAGAFSRKEKLRQLFYTDLNRVASETRYGVALNEVNMVTELEHRFVTAMSITAIYEKMTELRRWDSYSYDHSFDVFLLGTVLGHALQVNDPGNFSIGCLLHDIGKLEVPQSILQKKGKLTENEFRRIKKHTSHGYDIIRKMGLPEEFAVLAKSHHERLDGSGYPEGLHGSALDTKLRIISIVDVFSALTLQRVYRDPFPAADALETLFRDGGKFDFDLLRTFAETLHIFPAGSEIQLSDGKKATVTHVNPHFPAVPLLREHPSTYGEAIPFDLTMRFSSLLHWYSKEESRTKPVNEWNRYLFSLMYGDYREALDAFEYLTDGKRVEQIYTDVVAQGIKDIKQLYEESLITAADLNLARSLTREILYTTLTAYARKQRPKGKIALAATENGDGGLAVQIAAAVFKTNGWHACNFEQLLPPGILLRALLRRDIGIVCFAVSDDYDVGSLRETIAYLRNHKPELMITISGTGLPEEVRRWGDLYAEDATDLVRQLDQQEK
ncbi:MAG TPA: HD domain-containing phosphohydrolase, partial [Bacillales bacterium]|nr:HD domain-containing phosphohydrolase [Bacillales bacterium]